MSAPADRRAAASTRTPAVGGCAAPSARTIPSTIAIIERLLELGATVQAYDPEALATARRLFGDRIALYTKIGFVLSVTLLLFVLLFFIERRNLWRALAVSIGVTVGSYLLFSTLLKSPLPPMPFWY